MTSIFAVLINCINEKRLLIGESTVGFVNPVPYKISQEFRENTSICNSDI